MCFNRVESLVDKISDFKKSLTYLRNEFFALFQVNMFERIPGGQHLIRNFKQGLTYQQKTTIMISQANEFTVTKTTKGTNSTGMVVRAHQRKPLSTKDT